MMKRSQTKKISAMLAAVTVLWGGELYSQEEMMCRRLEYKARNEKQS